MKKVTVTAEAPKYVHVLRKPEEVISLRSRILRKDVSAYEKMPSVPVDEYRGYSVAQLLLGNYKTKSGEIMETNKVFLTQVPASRKSPYIEGTITREQVCGLTVDRFSKAFVNVRIDNAADPQSILTKIRLGVWESNGKYYFHVGKKYVEVEQGAEFDSLPATAIHYGANSTASNGQIKSKEITLYAENLPGFDPAEMLDELTFGLVHQLEANRRESKTVKQVAQLSTRLAQPDAPAVEGGVHFHVEAYYMGIYNPLWDGESYVSANFAADWVEERLGRKIFHVLPSAVKGLCFQARPHMVKGNSSVLSREALTDFLSSRTWKPVVIERTSVSPEEQKAFNEAIWSKGKNGSFAGKIVVICDHRSDIGKYGVELFTDLNGLKETFDLRTTTGLNVLDMTAEEEDLRRTSTQTFATYCVADYERAKVLHDRAVKGMLEKKVSGLFDVEEDGILGDELASDSHKHLSIHDFDHEGVNWEDASRTVAPRFYSKVWRPGYKRIVSKMIEGLDTKFGRSNLDIEGTYGVIVVDPAIDYGFNSLRFDSEKCEVLAPALRDGTMGLMNRFPMANCFGQSKIVAVSKKELVDRAWRYASADGDDLFDLDSLKYYVERINAVPEGVVVVPASQSLMNKHDGWDFDGDHVNIVTDSDYVALYDLIGSMIVDIESGESAKAECHVSLDAGVTRRFWEMTVISPNPAVGQVINAFQVFSSVLVDAKAWKAEGEKSSHGKLARNVFSVVFNNHGGTVEHYQGLPRHEEADGLHVSVSTDMAVSAMDEMSSMKLTAENIIAAAEDMQAIARMYAETVIDASKNGAHVVIERFKDLQKISPESRQEIATKIVWDNKEVKIPYNRGAVVAAARKAGKVLTGDIFHELRVRGLKDTARLAKQLVAVEQTLPEATVKWAKSRAQVLKKETEIVSFVRSNLYMSIMSMQKDAVKKANDAAGRDKKLARQMEKVAKQPFNALMSDARDMLRYALKGVSYIDRVAISLAIAISAAEKSHKGMKADNFMSDFASKLFEEEFFLFVLTLGQQKSGKEVIGEVPQYTMDKVSRVEGFADGDEVDFVYGEAVGANGEFALAKDKMLTGHFVLKDETAEDGSHHWYAAKSIKDLVNVPEGSGDKLVFSTGCSDTTRVEALARFVKPGQKVELVNKVTIDGKVCKNVVIINGKAVFSYKKDFCMESIYSDLSNATRGTVSSVVMAPNGKMAIISLEGVKKVSVRELSSEKITWAKIPSSFLKNKAKQAVNSYAPSFFKKKH